MKTTQSEENYLKQIYRLSGNRDEWVNTNDLASKVNLKASSVTDMVQKLYQKKLVEYKKYKGVKLSVMGKELAINVIRKHRLWEVFQALGVNVLVDFERKKVGRRNIIPVRATVRMGGEGAPSRMTVRRDAIPPGPTPTHVDPAPEQETLCGKDGRGERI